MNGILHILDQTGLGLAQLQRENADLRQRIEELEAEARGAAEQ